MRNTLSPHPIHKLINRHHTINLNQQRRQHTSLPSMAQVNPVPIDPGLDIAKKLNSTATPTTPAHTASANSRTHGRT